VKIAFIRAFGVPLTRFFSIENILAKSPESVMFLRPTITYIRRRIVGSKPQINSG
jgi:hypothetical protein